jgi:protein-S-isoprenylcysteine O-methyltransferase Ste14
MNAPRDLVRMTYRCGVVACATLVVSQVVTLFLPRLALALEGLPRVITAYAGCGLLVASLIYSRVKDPLFFFGLAIGIAAILISCMPAFIRA